MVRLGVISDSHRADHWVRQFLKRANAQRYDAVYFLGDGEAEARWLARRLDMPLYALAGNCDMPSKNPRERVDRWEGCTLLAAHGHTLDVKWGLQALSYRASEVGAGVALYGHTHEPRAEYVGPVLTFNPGALMEGCYGELTIDGGRIVPRLFDLMEG